MAEDDTIIDQYRVDMQTLGGYLHRLLNGDHCGDNPIAAFVLLTMPFGDAKLCNYVSNANRADMVAALKSIIVRLEGH